MALPLYTLELVELPEIATGIPFLYFEKNGAIADKSMADVMGRVLFPGTSFRSFKYEVPMEVPSTARSRVTLP
jgi:hypothetical protein